MTEVVSQRGLWLIGENTSEKVFRRRVIELRGLRPVSEAPGVSWEAIMVTDPGQSPRNRALASSGLLAHVLLPCFPVHFLFLFSP